MCGIVGAVVQRGVDVAGILLQCLKKLEYRGNDSVGIAVWHELQGLQHVRSIGKVDDLNSKLRTAPLLGNIGIAHTRWATHGKPSENNAHPHISSNSIAVVQNGIIENYEELRAELLAKGYIFSSETDTEVVAHLLHSECSTNDSFLLAVQKAIAKLQGSFALVILNKDQPDSLIAVRYGNPLVVGIGEKGNFIASDTVSLLSLTNKFIYLEDGDIVDIRADKVTFYDKDLSIVNREVKICRLSSGLTDKGEYKYYMQKEIFEQSAVVKDTIASDFEALSKYIRAIASEIKRIAIVACGSSYHAAMVGRYWIEDLAGLPCSVEIASEFRYREVAVEEGTLFVTISQSGETADTLAALRKAKKNSINSICEEYIGNLTICNVEESTLVRDSDAAFITKAGVEIGVASTKAFTTQLVALFLLALELMFGSNKHSKCDERKKERLLFNLSQMPFLMQQVIMLDDQIQQLAKELINKEHMFFLGRGVSYPTALEGALKMKEISYLHAEAYPAGELKHGPLALIVEGVPVIVLAPNDSVFEKLKSNVNEVASRGGELVIFTDSHVSVSGNNDKIVTIKMPTIVAELTPFLYVIPLQLLAYHVADLRGNNVDQPRNLAKSVTVE